MRAFFVIFNKELLSFLRSYGLVLVVLYSFTIDVYIAGEGIRVKPQNVSVGYVDYSNGVLSQKILSSFHAPEFLKPKRFNSQEALSKAIFNKEIVVGLIFENDFEKNYRLKRDCQIDVLLDSTAAATAFTTLSYLQNIVLNFSSLNFPIEIKTHKLFNQNSDNRYFLSLSELLSVITLLIVILTAVVFVKEKEDGTWDIMLLTPIDSKLIILAKSLSQVFIVLMGIILSLGFVVLKAFDTPLNGSFFAFMLLSFFYALTSGGIGLFIAAISKNVMQVAQLSIIIMMPIIFLSGAWTPIYAMHPILQFLSLFSPLRYYIEATESIFFRGTDFFDLWPYFAGVLGLGAVVYIFGFRKIGRLF